MHKYKTHKRLVLLLLPFFIGCNGSRYIYSVSPQLSPVPQDHHSTSISANYFSHNKNEFAPDSSKNRDNGFSLSVAHMATEQLLLVGSIDFKKEKSIVSGLTDSIFLLRYNGGFDSSFLDTKRKAATIGLVYFFYRANENRKLVPSIAGSIGVHQLVHKESGTDAGAAYHRFFNDYQLAVSGQYNLLFQVSKRLKFGYIARITMVKFLHPDTDFTRGELGNTGFHKKIAWYASLFGGYASIQPFRKIPFLIDAQLYNDVIFWKKTAAKYETGRSYIKGSGIAIGVKHVF